MFDLSVWRCPLDDHEVFTADDAPQVSMLFESIEIFVERHEYLAHGIRPAPLSYYDPDEWVLGDFEQEEERS